MRSQPVVLAIATSYLVCDNIIIIILPVSLTFLYDLRGDLTIYIESHQLDSIRLHTFMFAPLILKIVLKNSLSHKHSNDLFYFNIAPSILKLESILCATPPQREKS